MSFTGVHGAARRRAVAGRQLIAAASVASVGRAASHTRLAAVMVLSLVLATAVAWVIDRHVTGLMSAQLVARASDQVEFGLLPRITPADFEPPFTPAKLDELSARLDWLLDRARESGSGTIRINLFARDGTVLYSDVASLRGQVVSPLTDAMLAAALAGSAGAQITSLAGSENADLAPRYGTALEAYVPCVLDGRVVGAYEYYADLEPLRPIRWAIWISVGLGFALLVLGVLALERGFGSRRVPHSIGPIGSPVGRSPYVPSVIASGLVRLESRGEAGVGSPATPLALRSECWLTRREMEVLRLLASMRTYRDIAAELSLSEETVRSHVKSVLRKLGQPDRVRAVSAAIRAGILPT